MSLVCPFGGLAERLGVSRSKGGGLRGGCVVGSVCGCAQRDGLRRDLLHPFAAAFFFDLAGFVMLPYLTAIKLGGAGIGNRSLTRQREEKAAAGDTACAYVRDVRS